MLAKPSKSTEHGEHVVPLKYYLGVAGALYLLTVLTVAVSFVHLGPFNTIVAMLIAGVKASLVALIFMHLFWDNKLLLFIFLTSLVFLAIFIGLTLADTLRRGDIYSETGGPINPQSEMYAPGDTTATGGQSEEAGVIPSDTYTSGADTSAADTAATDTAGAADTTQPATGDTGNQEQPSGRGH